MWSASILYTPWTHKNTPANTIINKCIHILSNYLSIQRLSENITLYRQKINEMYRRVKCYHYMGVWAYNSWIRSNWIHWKSRYIPIINRGNTVTDLNTTLSVTDRRMSFLLSVKDLNIPTEMTCLLHRFQWLCMAHTTLYIQKNAYYIQIFTLCNCIMYISTLTCRQRVTHKLVNDGPERNTVTDLSDCLWRTPRHWTELRPGAWVVG